MSDTHQDDRLQLVPLVATLTSIEKPLLDLGQVFDLAMKGDIRLYVRLPPGKVAYVDEFLPIVVRRQSSMYIRDMGDFTRYSPLSHQMHPEITHVALDPDQAGELKTKRVTSDMAFASGLARHPDSTLAQAGWWMPRQFGASLVICPAPPESEAEKKRQRVRRIWLKAAPEDVYVDENIVALLTDPQASSRDDPFHHRDRAPGVYVLYCAARDYRTALETKQVTFEKVQAKVAKQLPMLSDDDVPYVVKFINPGYRRNSGIPKPEQRQLDQDIIKSPDFIAKYKSARFINDSLGLVLYVTDRWLDSYTKFKEGITEKPQGIWDLRENFRKLGFYENELEALILLILWRQPATPA